MACQVADLEKQVLILHRTLQEGALAPRTLKFGSEFLIWECLEMRASEIEPSMATSTRDFRDFTHKALLSNAIENHNLGVTGVLSQAWGRLSMEYTQRSLTFIKDRWTAISSVARKLALECNVQFVAGLAVDDIERHLLWISRTPGRRLPNGAPSWSWVSVDCAAVQDFRQTVVQIKVLELPVDSAGLEQMWLLQEEETETGVPSFLQELLHPLKVEAPTCKFNLTDSPEGEVELKATDNEMVLDCRIHLDVKVQNLGADPIFGLQHSYKEVVRSGESRWEVDTILIRQVSHEPAYFQRIGTGNVSVRNSLRSRVMGLEDFGQKGLYTLI